MFMTHRRTRTAMYRTVPAHPPKDSTGYGAGTHFLWRGRTSVDLPANVVEFHTRSGRRQAALMRRRNSVSEAGMATAEYAIATLAAVGFAGLLVFILRSDEVRGFLLTLIRTALALP